MNLEEAKAARAYAYAVADAYAALASTAYADALAADAVVDAIVATYETVRAAAQEKP